MKHRIGVLALLSLMIIVTLPGTSGANSQYRSAWLAAYPSACQTLKDAVASCALCHTSVPDLNPYGTDLVGHRTNLAATNNDDPDLDGKTNIVEIEHCTFPGNALSKPVPNDERTWGTIKALYR
jgi:hypothetical protein